MASLQSAPCAVIPRRPIHLPAEPMRNPPQTRSYSANTIALLATDAGGATEPSPWLNPLRLVRTAWIRMRWWALGLGVAGLTLGAIIGFAALRSTFSLSSSLELVSASTPFNAEKDGESYKAPTRTPRELESLLDQMFIYERLQVTAGDTTQTYKFRKRFRLMHARDTSVFEITFKDAASAKQAEEVLDTFCQIVLLTVREMVSGQIQRDRDYFKHNVEETEAEVNQAIAAVDEFRRKNGFVYLEQEVIDRQQRVSRFEEALIAAKKRLADLTYNLEQVPKLIAAQPKEADPTNAGPLAANESLLALRNEVRRLEGEFTEEFPRLKAARKELAAMEEDYQRQVAETKRSQSPAGQLVAKMQEQLQSLELQKPWAEHELADAESRLTEARKLLDGLPALSAQYMALERIRQDKADLLRRLRTRLEEIEIAFNLSLNSVRVLDPPAARQAIEFPRWLKTLITAGAGLTLGWGAAFAIGLFRGVRDRHIRNFSDCAMILHPERVTRLPSGRWATGEHLQRWIQDLAAWLTRSHQRFLIIPTGDVSVSAGIATALAKHIARSGSRTLLLAPALENSEGQKEPGHGSGITHIIHRGARREECCRRIEDNLDLMTWGDGNELFDGLPSGRLEGQLKTLFEDELGEYRSVVILPPVLDASLIQRLGPLADCFVVLVDPKDDTGDTLLEIVRGARLPVTMGILTR